MNNHHNLEPRVSSCNTKPVGPEPPDVLSSLALAASLVWSCWSCWSCWNSNWVHLISSLQSEQHNSDTPLWFRLRAGRRTCGATTQPWTSHQTQAKRLMESGGRHETDETGQLFDVRCANQTCSKSTLQPSCGDGGGTAAFLKNGLTWPARPHEKGIWAPLEILRTVLSWPKQALAQATSHANHALGNTHTHTHWIKMRRSALTEEDLGHLSLGCPASKDSFVPLKGSRSESKSLSAQRLV